MDIQKCISKKLCNNIHKSCKKGCVECTKKFINKIYEKSIVQKNKYIDIDNFINVKGLFTLRPKETLEETYIYYKLNKKVTIYIHSQDITTSPLVFACFKNTSSHTECVRLLLKTKMINIHTTDENGFEAIHYASQHNNIAVIKLLLENGADINENNPLCFTPLIFALSTDSVDAVKYLIEKGADYEHMMYDNLRDFDLKKKKCIDYFLQNKLYEDVYIGNRNHGYESFNLIQICCWGTKRITTKYLKYVLKYFSNHGLLFGKYGINYQNEKGDTALHNSMRAENKKCIKLLIEYGADIHIKNKKGEIPLKCGTSHKTYLYAKQIYDNLIEIKEPSEE